MSGLPKSLYEVLEMRRVNSRIEEEHMRKRILANLCPKMSIEEMKSLLNKTEKEFKRKTRVNKIMIDEIDLVADETKKILEAFLSKNKINVEEVNVEDVVSDLVNEEVNVDIEDIQIPLDVANTKVPMEIEAPKVVLAKGKEIPNE